MQIFALFECDEWKSHSSMSLLMLTTDRHRLVDAIKDELRKNQAEYKGLESDTKKMAETFEKDAMPFLNNIVDSLPEVDYLYVEFAEDGELL